MKTKMVVVIVLILLGIVAYLYFFGRLTKDKAIKLILESTMSSNAEFLKTADEKYLKAWAKAINKGEATFELNNKTYNTKGGKQNG